MNEKSEILKCTECSVIQISGAILLPSRQWRIISKYAEVTFH